MEKTERIGIIGSGATCIYVLKHLLEHQERIGSFVHQVQIFERDESPGIGMPYHPSTTDIHHLCNISSHEIPDMGETLVHWLGRQSAARLAEWGIRKEAIDGESVYPRIALGAYFRERFLELCAKLRAAAIEVEVRAGCEIVDIVHTSSGAVSLVASDMTTHELDRVFVCVGHEWPDEDVPGAGYFASPWPIAKLLPQVGEHFNFEVGLLGASLSAFDVVTSLAHRHGRFFRGEGGLEFVRFPHCEHFKLFLHSKSGRLPHLQFEQVRPMREIYRHIRRDELLDLRREGGWLRLDDYFNDCCRPLLAKAFREDGRTSISDSLMDVDGYSLEDFVAQMTEEHDYDDAFEGARRELLQAKRMGERPFHWKEILDDLMYTLNFHAEMLPAEDHLRLKGVMMPFLLNVVAAMPLHSAETLLALRDADCIDLVQGEVLSVESDSSRGHTLVKVQNEASDSEYTYKIFVDCSGQGSVELEEYPFPSMVREGRVRKARAFFADDAVVQEEAVAHQAAAPSRESQLIESVERGCHFTGGIDVDASYRVVESDGRSSSCIYELSFPHTLGIRPYSYGLQACNETAALSVKAMVLDVTSRATLSVGAESSIATASLSLA